MPIQGFKNPKTPKKERDFQVFRVKFNYLHAQ
jgi:hypothetical protein